MAKGLDELYSGCTVGLDEVLQSPDPKSRLCECEESNPRAEYKRSCTLTWGMQLELNARDLSFVAVLRQLPSPKLDIARPGNSLPDGSQCRFSGCGEKH